MKIIRIITGILVLILSLAIGYYFYRNNAGIVLTVCVTLLPICVYVCFGILNHNAILTTPVDLTERELTILKTALFSELDEHMRAKQIGVTSTVAMHIQDCIEEIKHLQVKLNDAIKDLDSVK